jgi:hypothetical protein
VTTSTINRHYNYPSDDDSYLKFWLLIYW